MQICTWLRAANNSDSYNWSHHHAATVSKVSPRQAFLVSWASMSKRHCLQTLICHHTKAERGPILWPHNQLPLLLAAQLQPFLSQRDCQGGCVSKADCAIQDCVLKAECARRGDMISPLSRRQKNERVSGNAGLIPQPIAATPLFIFSCTVGWYVSNSYILKRASECGQRGKRERARRVEVEWVTRLR